MNKRAINHHIVPEVFQKQFTVDGDPARIWRAKKCERGIYLAPEKKRIRKTFVIRDYYTILERDQRSDRIEREFYGEIDNFLGCLLPNVIRILKDGDVPSFSSGCLNSLRQVVLHMAKRTPDTSLEADDIDVGKEVVASYLEALPSKVPLTKRKSLEAKLADPTRLRDEGRTIRVLATLKSGDEVDRILSECVPRWSISQTKHSYILSSKMVYRIGNGGSNGLINPMTEIWMPITPKFCLVLLRDPMNRIPNIVVDTPEHIRKVNEYAAKCSHEIASHSEQLLKSLIRA